MQLDWAFVGSAAWSYPLFHASGVAGACGWLALLALVGGGPREKLGTVCAFLSAIGRRSMTAYLSQTVLFILICGLAISFGAFAGRRRVRPDCARRVGADRPGLRHCRGFGIVARSR